MQEQPITDAVRALMPQPMLNLSGLPLNEADARKVAERQAMKLLELLDITEPSVEVELIAELPNIEVEVLPNLSQSGFAGWVHDHWHILINADDSLWRCRATLAHEYKHILDDPFQELLYPDWDRSDPEAAPPEMAERICDYFAGCLLVPKQWLYEAWDDGRQDVAKLATHFDVSESLVEVRMDQTRVRERPVSKKRRLQRASHDAYQRSAGIVRSATRRIDGARQAATSTSKAAMNKLTKGEKDDHRDLCPSVTSAAA